MKVNTYTNQAGQLVSDYTEEKPGEYLEFITQRMNIKEHEKPKKFAKKIRKHFYKEAYPSQTPTFTGKYSVCSDEFLLNLKRIFEEKPLNKRKRLNQINIEIKKRGL